MYMTQIHITIRPFAKGQRGSVDFNSLLFRLFPLDFLAIKVCGNEVHVASPRASIAAVCLSTLNRDDH